MSSTPQTVLLKLIDHLAGGPYPSAHHWHNWSITRIDGGANGIVYRAVNAPDDLAVKFTLRDERDRAGREYGALLALKQASLDLAPTPLLLERSQHPQDVVVQTWLEGPVLGTPPRTEREWFRLLQHYRSIHSLTPDQVASTLPEAVMTATNAASAKELVHSQVERIPRAERAADLCRLLQTLHGWRAPEWPETSRALCRCDPNSRNIICRPGAWASVDWENSGWGDPAFDLADMMAHPAFIGTTFSRWKWFADQYSSLSHDPTVSIRVYTYYTILLVWWVARLARYLYEMPRGLDRRLAGPSSDWQTSTQRKYDYYVHQAQARLAKSGRASDYAGGV